MSNNLEIIVPGHMAPLDEFINSAQYEEQLSVSADTNQDHLNSGVDALYFGGGMAVLMTAAVIFAGRKGDSN